MSNKLPGNVDNNPASKGVISATSDKFEALADRVDKIIGTPYWFAFSLLIIIVWFPSGFFFDFGEIWHLMINTTTTILTFIMMSLLHASESKWERNMEKMEEYQRASLNFLKKETERIAQLEEAHLKNIEQFQQDTINKERISSLN